MSRMDDMAEPSTVTGLTIIRQPQPWGALEDEKVTFTVVAISDNDLTFEWKLNDATIGQDKEIKQEQSSDGKSSTICIMKFSPAKHKGMYHCVVTDPAKRKSLSSKKVELRDFEDELKIMKGRPLKNELLIVIIGRTGMGKSSLFNSLVGEKVATEGHSCDPVTESIVDMEHTINGIKVRLVDTPGFGALLGEPTTDTMKKIAERLPGNGEDVNLVIYCISMAKDARLNNTDGEIAGELTKTYDQNIWENTLVALTFACQKKPGETITATKFNKLVGNYSEGIRTKLLVSAGKVSKQVAQDIPILPVDYFTPEVGKTQHECCTLPDGSNWLSNFWYQSILRIRDPQARYAFYRATCNIHPYLRENEHRKLTQE